jgi:hypothetical protein
MRKLMMSFAVALLVGLLATSPALAGRSWCAKDPVFKIDGQVVDVRLSSYVEMNDEATGPTTIVLLVPPGVKAGVYAMDQGFGKYGYSVKIVNSPSLHRHGGSIPIRVQVLIPSTDTTLPVVVDVTARGHGPITNAIGKGSSNHWVVTATT